MFVGQQRETCTWQSFATQTGQAQTVPGAEAHIKNKSWLYLSVHSLLHRPQTSNAMTCFPVHKQCSLHTLQRPPYSTFNTWTVVCVSLAFMSLIMTVLSAMWWFYRLLTESHCERNNEDGDTNRNTNSYQDHLLDGGPWGGRTRRAQH